MRTCPTCSRSFVSGFDSDVCPDDGTVLETSAPPTNDPPLEPGAQVGEYVVEARLGGGTFGEVYRAVHPLIGKLAAVKVLARKYSVDPETVSRFMAEARVVNQIRHANIVDVFSFGTLDDGRCYHIMELLEGQSLDEYVTSRGGRLSLADTLELLGPIARALDAAHAADVVHRDIKPANVFIASGPDGAPNPKLLDFGLAKLLEDDTPVQHRTASGTAVGTPAYMSPEQCEGRRIDHRSDIYAFGCVVFRMLTGTIVFEASNVVSLMMAHIERPVRRPSDLARHLPPAVDGPIVAMLEKAPEDRPASATEALALLRSAAESSGADLTARGDGAALGEREAVMATWTGGTAATPLAHVGQSNPWVLWAIVAASLLLGGYLAVSSMMSDPPTEQVNPPVRAGAVDLSPPPAMEVAMPPETKDPPTPAPPPKVELQIVGIPDGTALLVGGVVTATSPQPVQIERSQQAIEIELRRDGYQTARVTVVPDDSKDVTAALKKLQRAKPPGQKAPALRPGRNDVENPF